MIQPLATERINTVDLISSFADPNFLDADPDPDPACHFNADPVPNPSFLIKAQYFKSAQIGSYSIHFSLSSAN
jgi:hypothetical protein